jgi:hypothetical protein
MKPVEFPLYGSFDAARSHGCFVCLAPLPDAPIRDFNFPPGRGQWAMHCKQCGCWTFFDVREAA